MDAMDILGELLGNKTSKPGRGTDALKDVFRRGSKQSTASTPKSRGDINREAEELEDLLNVAQDRSSSRTIGSRQSNSSRETQPFPQQTSSPRREFGFDRDQHLDNERAVVLIRAMVNAAKADGRIDKAEQDKIIEKLGGAFRENIVFLRKEFAAPLDVKAFVESVPLGMEQQVYTMSLIAIDLDEGSEASYLRQLAQGLRIPLDVREQICRRLGVPIVH